MALHTKLDNVHRGRPAERLEDDHSFMLSLPPYTAQELQPSEEHKEFNCDAQYLRSVDPGAVGSRELVESYFVFLYEVCCSQLTFQAGAVPKLCCSCKCELSFCVQNINWNVNDHAQTNRVRSLGPAHFQAFPHHHFFARVYRPVAVSTLRPTGVPLVLIVDTAESSTP